MNESGSLYAALRQAAEPDVADAVEQLAQGFIAYAHILRDGVAIDDEEELALFYKIPTLSAQCQNFNSVGKQCAFLDVQFIIYI